MINQNKLIIMIIIIIFVTPVTKPDSKNIPTHIQTIKTFLHHFCVTIDSVGEVFRSQLNLLIITKIQTSKIIGKNVVVFVHGRNGKFVHFKQTIENIAYLNKIVNDELIDDQWDVLKGSMVDFQNMIIKLKDGNNYAMRIVSLGNNAYTSLDEDADTLEQEISQYLDCNITLIGLSKGGVVSMRYATTKNDHRIKKVITISSPLKGTLIASLFPTNSVVNTNLGYMNQISQDIEHDVNNKKNIPKIYHIVPKWDHMIIPVDSAMYNSTPDCQILYYNQTTYGHFNIQNSMEVAATLSNWLIQ